MCWQSKDFIGEGCPGRKQKGGEPQRTALPRGLQFYDDGISFWVVFGQSSWLRILAGGTHIAQPRWIPERRILGGGRMCGVSLWPFPNSSSWWWLVSSMFLTRTSCLKITHTNGYYGAWSGWVVSVSVFLLTGWAKGLSLGWQRGQSLLLSKVHKGMVRGSSFSGPETLIHSLRSIPWAPVMRQFLETEGTGWGGQQAAFIEFMKVSEQEFFPSPPFLLSSWELLGLRVWASRGGESLADPPSCSSATTSRFFTQSLGHSPGPFPHLSYSPVSLGDVFSICFLFVSVPFKAVVHVHQNDRCETLKQWNSTIHLLE